MQYNVGGLDRALRILIGLLLLGLMFSDALAITDTIGRWGWIGIIPLVTGLLGWCPLYLPKGINTSTSNNRTYPATQ
jgi:hypothetical protein